MNRYDVDYFLETAPTDFQKLVVTDPHIHGAIVSLKNGDFASVNQMLMHALVMMSKRCDSAMKLYIDLANSTPRTVILPPKEVAK